MAVITNCNSIIQAYTHCSSVIAIYTHCSLVWPLGPVPPGDWYVKWEPSNLSGSFHIWGSSYRYESFPGIYTWSGPKSTSGMINGAVFYDSRTGTEGHMTYMETNVLSIGSDTVGIAPFEYNIHLESISCLRCRYVGVNAFKSCTSLQYAYLPRVTKIDFGAFMQCSSLTTLYAPMCEYVGGSAFNGAGLTELDLPVCSRVGADGFRGNDFSSISLPACEILEGAAFKNCTNLIEVYLPACSDNWGGFPGCTALERVDMPVCTYTGWSAFSGCTSLSEVSLPVCSQIGSHAFDGCVNLRSIELPAMIPETGSSSIYAKGVSECAFRSCTLISYVDLGSCSIILNSAFSDCVNLSTLILRNSSIVRLAGGDPYPFSNIFYNTPFLNCSGYIYVPSSLVSAYKNDPIWYSVSCVIRPIGSEPGPEPPGPVYGSYYVSWTPTSATGYLTVDVSVPLEDYNGYYSVPESFGSTLWKMSGNMTYVETNLTSVNMNAFYRCYSLVSVSMSECEFIGNYAFAECSSLSKVYFPACSYVGNYAFNSCRRIRTMDLPLCEQIGSSAFTGCSGMSTLKLPVCSMIGNYLFGNVSVRTTIILGYSGVCSLKGTLTSQFSQFSGSIYVPSSLVTAYKNNGAWYYYQYSIFPISEP